MAVETMHRKGCATKGGKKRCNCSPSYRAVIYNGSGKRLKRIFPTHAAALSFSRSGTKRAVSDMPTLTEAAEALFAGMYSGAVLNRNLRRYKRRVVQAYEADYTNHVKNELGPKGLDALDRRTLQKFADGLAAEYEPATVRNIIKPISVTLRRALRDGLIDSNPAVGLELERPTGTRSRVSPPTETRALLDALPYPLRAFYGCAAYAGMRRGEIAALRWDAIEWDAGTILVSEAYDLSNLELIETKSRRSRRVPLLSDLRKLLLYHQSHTVAGTLVFHRDDGIRPIAPDTVAARADVAWKEAKLQRITLHEFRHSYASVMIEAGVDLKQLGEFLGHKSISTTVDIYGHLLPGSAARAAEKMEAAFAANENKKKPEPPNDQETPAVLG